MREIKFRAWVPMDRVMYYLPQYFLDLRIGKWMVATEHVMQYTGLRDKNGKEIYEGDIVKTTPWSVSYLEEVKWDDRGAWVLGGKKVNPADKKDKRRHWALFWGNEQILEWTEVVGNVYETPNLLPCEKPSES